MYSSRLIIFVAALALTGCASNAPPERIAAESESEEQIPIESDAANVGEVDEPVEPIEEQRFTDKVIDALSDEIEVSAEEEAKIEAAQNDVYDLVKGTATQIDSFFGTSSTESEATVSRGRVSVGGQYDERKGYKPRFRVKARIKLPLLEEKTQLLIGRGQADDLVDGSSNENMDTLPGRFQGIDDDEWLFGIGYSRDKRRSRGFDFSVGAVAKTPLEPYARISYKWHHGLGDAWLLNLRPMIYWQEGRGNGASIQATLDYSPFDNWLFRSYTFAQNDDRFDGISWTSKLFTYHKLSNKSAFSYGLYASGVREADVPLQNYGLEIRHRRQISRKYLYVEFLTYFSWPRKLLEEEREFTPGIGIEFELQFGEWPGRSGN